MVTLIRIEEEKVTGFYMAEDFDKLASGISTGIGDPKLKDLMTHKLQQAQKYSANIEDLEHGFWLLS